MIQNIVYTIQLHFIKPPKDFFPFFFSNKLYIYIVNIFFLVPTNIKIFYPNLVELNIKTIMKDRQINIKR